MSNAGLTRLLDALALLGVLVYAALVLWAAEVIRW